MLGKSLKINYIILMILLVISFIFCQVPNAYAGIAKWDAYTEWGLILKLSVISLWLSIPITIVGIITKLILHKLNNKSKVYDKVTNTIILIFFSISLISRIIVELNMYNNAIICLVIGMLVCLFLIFLFRNMKILSTSIFYIIILCILIILLITNDNVYPYEYNDVHEVEFKETLIEN